jgi:hypothetical protein
LVTTVHDASGALRSGASSVAISAPLESHERILGIGEEGFLWRGYGNNERGVVRVRIGRYLIEINAPTVAEAERLARAAVAPRGKPVTNAIRIGAVATDPPS